MKRNILLKVAALLALSLSSCGTKHYEPKEYILELPWQENFRILQLNDIHIGNKDDQQLQFDFIDLTIEDERAKPNLIIICGDLFTFADKVSAKRTFAWLDSHKIPWTVTWGNHDEQCYFSIDWVTNYLNDLTNSDDSYCVFKDIQDDDIMGNSNFAINLMKDGKVKEQIIVFDSNRYNFGQYKDYDSYTGYDAIHDTVHEMARDEARHGKALKGLLDRLFK